MSKVQFQGLLKEVRVRSLVSNDKGITIKIETEDLAALAAVELPADQEIQVTPG